MAKSALDEALDFVNKVANKATGTIRQGAGYLANQAVNNLPPVKAIQFAQNAYRQPVVQNFIRQPLVQQAVRTVSNQPLLSTPGAVGLSTRPSFSPTLGSYISNQIAKPLTTLANPKKPLADRVLSGMQGGFSLTPTGTAFNIGGGIAAGGLEALRTGKNADKTISQRIANPSSVATQGLGIKNPLLALGVDVALSGNPKTALRGIGGIAKGFTTQYNKKMAVGDIKSAVEAIERYHFNKSDIKYMMNKGSADEKTIRLLAGDYISKSFAKKGKLEDVMQELLNRVRVDQNKPEIRLGFMADKSQKTLKPLQSLIPEAQAKVVSQQVSPQGFQSQPKIPVGSSGGSTQSLSGMPPSNVSGSSKYAYNINKNQLQLNEAEKQTLNTVVDQIKPELETLRGRTLSNDEVIKAAKTSEIMTQVTTREQTLQAEAAMLRARQNMVSLDKNIDQLAKQGNTPLLQAQMKDLIDSLRVVSSNAADKGRQLQSLAIKAGDESVRVQVLKDVAKVNNNTDEIIKEAAKVDWNDANSITKFYRKFIKPTLPEILDEYRYNNMLSGPRTHIRNAFSNLTQTFITRPATLAAEGRPIEAMKYFGGATRNIPKAIDEFINSFRGKSPIEKPDLERAIPTGKLPKFFTIPTRLLEAGDKFFSTIIRGGELARGASPKQAEKTAAYYLFRGELKPEEQGKVLNAIDDATAGIYEFGRKVPIMRWFVPFVRTPMNFAKQWIEYSPAGLATLPGAKNKREQIAKAFLGSTATATGAYFAMQGKTTWAAPKDRKEKDQFYASGRKPFSIQVGNKWIPMIYAGPFAMALALPAAIKWYQEDSRTALTDTQVDKLLKISSSMAEYLSGQTFLEGMGNFVKLLSGDADYSLGSNLAFTAGQLIPMQGLVRYINTIIDPVYRKASGPLEALQKDIPGLSQRLSSYTTPTGEESKREPQNYVLPYDIGTNQPSDYEEMVKLGQLRAQSTQESVQRGDRAEEIYTKLKDKNVVREEKLSLIQEAIKDDKVGNKLRNMLRDEAMNLTPLESKIKSQDTVTRARYIKYQLSNMSPEEKKQLVIDYIKKKIITRDVAKEMLQK